MRICRWKTLTSIKITITTVHLFPALCKYLHLYYRQANVKFSRPLMFECLNTTSLSVYYSSHIVHPILLVTFISTRLGVEDKYFDYALSVDVIWMSHASTQLCIQDMVQIFTEIVQLVQKEKRVEWRNRPTGPLITCRFFVTNE